MAIKSYLYNGKKFYEVYVNGFDARANRIQKRKRGLESLRKAEDAQFEFERELARLKEEKVTLKWSEWFDECLKRMKIESRPSTVLNYEWKVKKWVHPHWKDREINSIDRSGVYEMVYETCSEIATPNSRKTLLKMIKRIFQMAVEEGILDRNPCSGITMKIPEVEQKVLTNSEVEIFLKQARLTNHRFYPMWVMALMTGMRSGELYELRWTDIDLDARIISVSRQWTSKNGICPTKTQRSRVVPISDDLMQYLKELKLQRGTDAKVLPEFTEWMNGEQAKITREFCMAINITQVKFHDLRATFITNLLARGESLAKVMSMVGHTQIKTTNGYLRKAGVDVQGGTDKLGYSLPREGSAKVFAIVK